MKSHGRARIRGFGVSCALLLLVELETHAIGIRPRKDDAVSVAGIAALADDDISV